MMMPQLEQILLSSLRSTTRLVSKRSLRHLSSLLNRSRLSVSSCSRERCQIDYTQQTKVPFSRSTLRLFSSKSSVRKIPSNIALPSYVNSENFKAPLEPEIKTDKQITQMMPACKLAASLLREIENHIKVGMHTSDIDDIVFSRCIEAGAYPSPLQYKGFPKSVCTSVNEVACHGIPGSQVLVEGDIINVDITVFYQGYHGDTSATFCVGEVDAESKRLMEATQDCLAAGIAVCREGAFFSTIGQVIYEKASEAGFEVIPSFCGHGIGTYFHGPPDIVHVPSDHNGTQCMRAGMTFTIEPILCAGSSDIKVLDDGWTVVTVDGSRTAQYEHTVLVTHSGCQILT